MNKTYKVIYNRTRCMYQVVSELAKGRTKSETPEMLKSLFNKHSGLTRGIVMAVLSMSLAMPVGVAVQAADTSGSSASETTTNTSSTTATDTAANVDLSNLTAAGEKVITDNASATVTSSIGTLSTDGNYIKTTNSVTGNLSALDTQAKANADAIAKETENRTSAVSAEAKAREDADTALSNKIGTTADAVGTNTSNISTNTTDITNLKNLSNITDAGNTVIKKQAKQAVKVAATGNATVSTTGSEDVDSTLIYTINVANNGAISVSDTNLVSGGTMYTELRPTGGTYVLAGNTTAANLLALDTNLVNVVNALGLDVNDTTKSYTSKLNKYFKVNPRITTSTDGTTTTTTYAPDAAANGTNAVAIGPSAQAGESTTDATTSTTTVTGGTSSTAVGDSAMANGNQAVALGYSASVLNPSSGTSTGSTAIGSNATVDSASNAMALGTKATINETATNGLAIGNGAVTGSAKTTETKADNTTVEVAAAGGVNSVAIGTGATNAGNTSIALGDGASVTNDTDGNYQAVVKSDDIAIGTSAKTSASDSSTAIGKSASVSQSTDAVAIGSSATASSSNDALVLGKEAKAASAADSIAMGTSAAANSTDVVAIGSSTSATGANSVVIGKSAQTTSEGGNAIGSSSTASGRSTAIGQSATANNFDALAIGNGATANADRSISLGYHAGVGTTEGKGETQTSGSLIAIGTEAGNNVAGMQNIAIGSSAGSDTKSNYNVAIGSSAGYNISYSDDSNNQNGYNVSIGYKANYQDTAANIMNAISIGEKTNAGNYAVAIGGEAQATGTNSIALGYKATAADTDSMALGYNSSAANGNIAIGVGSTAPKITMSTAYLTGDAAPSTYISVGTSDNLRRISNVADGSAAQDVVTVHQLTTAYTDLENTIKGIDTTSLNTYSTTAIDSKIADVKSQIANAKTKYFSYSTSTSTLAANADNTGATTTAADAMAIGPNANATNTKTLAIGNNVYAKGLRSIAIGTADNPTTDSAGTTTTHNTSAEGENSIALGTSTTAQSDNSVAIGTRAQTYTTDTTKGSITGVKAVAIGYSATTAGDTSVAVGNNATVKYASGTAVGTDSLADGTNAVAIGEGSKAYSDNSTAIGQGNSITGNNTYGLGSSNTVSGAWGSVTTSGVSGYNNSVTSVSDANTMNAISGIYITGNSNSLTQNVVNNVVSDITAMGSSNTIDAGAGGTSSHSNTLSQIAIVGSGNTVQGKSSDDSKTNNIKDVTILGYNNKVDANTDTTVDFSNTQILGSNVTAKLGNSVYLGSNAAYIGQTTAASDAITSARTAADAAAEASDAYKAATTDAAKAQIKAQYEAQYLYQLNVQAMEASGTTAGTQSYSTDETYGDGTSYTYAGSSPAGVVTVGSVGAERRIQNVAAGLVSATSTDAVNGSQLYALTRQIRFGGDNSSFGKTTAADDQNVVARGSNEAISITGGSDAVTSSTADGTTTYTVDSAKLTGNNIAVVADADKNALHVQLASNLKNLNTAQLGSGSGDSYKETIKLDGTDTTNGGTLALKDASGANGVTIRTSGTAKTADVTGTETSRLLVNDKTVATTDDGLKFGGDTGTDSALKLNNKLTVKGGTTDTNKLTDNNIGVVSDGTGTLTVKLNKDVNLGTDGSLTAGTVTATTVNATTVKTGDSTLTTSGLSIANGPSVLTSGINAGNKKITSVTAGETDTDAANYGQVKAAKTTLTAQGSNVTITPDTTSDDKHTNYTVSVSNLSYKAGTDTTAKNITLSNGLTFQNGKNTTAVAGDNGTITYNLNDKIELGAETDSNNHIVVDGTQGLLTLGMDATINGNAGIASIGGVSIGKSGSNQVITGLTNKTWTVGTTQAVDGRAATENQLQSVADNLNTANTNIATLQHGFKVQANGDTTTESTVKADDALNFTAGDNTNVTTTKDSKQITISVDNLSVKDNNGTAQSVKLADGLNFQDGTNTMAVVGTNGSVTYDLKSYITLGTSTDEANRIIVNGTNGTITVGNLATINGNAGTASIGGVSIGKSGSDQTVTGLSNRTWVVGESTAVNGRAATEDQLQSVSNDAYTNANNITMLQQGFTVTTNNDTDKKSTVKAGDNLNFQVGKNVQISTTADSKSIEVALSGTPEFTTVTSKDASGNTTIVSSTGVTITPNGTGTQSVSLTSEGLDNGNHVIKNVASGGTERTNAANIGDLQDAISNASTTATNTGFKVKGDDATSQTVKLGKQLNVVGGTTDSTQLSTGNIGVETTADAEGNATLTVKLNKNINLDSVEAGNTILDTNGVSNGKMSLTGTGMTITDTDASKQVSVTTSGVSMGSQQIKNVADGTDAKDAVNKGQLDAVQTQVTNGWQIAGSNGQKVADIGAGKKVTFGDTTYATASVQPDGTDGAKVTYTINTAEITDNVKTGVVTAPTTDGVATAQNVAQAINNAAWKIKANDNEATAIKAGTTVRLKAGNNLTLSQSNTDFTYRLNDELTGIKRLTTDAQDGVTTTLAASGVTIASSGTGNKSVSLTANGLNNGGKQITDVASGGDTDTNAANISDVKRLVQASASGTTETGFNVKGDDATAKKVKLGKQLNVVGGTTDSSSLSDDNIGVVTTADDEGNATLTVKLNKDITLDSVKTGNTTLNTNGVSNGKMNLTGTGMTITDTDASKQVSVTTSGVSMGRQRIQNVANAEVDTDAATLGQVKNARTKMTAGSNVAGVDSSEDKTTHQMTYTVNVDNLSVKANNEAAKSVTLKNGLTFNDGTNTTASVGEGGVVSFGLKPEISLTKVTTGNTTMDTNGLAILGGPTIAAGGINAGGKTVTGVANGVGDNDAVNISQLKAVQSDINAGWTIKGKDTANADVSANIGKGKTVTYDNGNYTKSVVTKDDSTGNATVKVDVTTGTFGSGTGDKAGTVTSTANGLATTQDVATAVNNASWTIQDGNNTGNAQQVKVGDKVSLKAGDNLSLEQNGKEFTYKLNQTLTNMNSVTAVDDKQNTAVLNGEGLKVTDAQGNALTQHATEVRLHDANKAADDTTTDVVLNKQGLQNGGHTITGVADGTVDASSQDAVNGSQLYALQQKVTNGWKITGDDTTKASNIGNDKTVSFVNGDNSYIKSKVDTTNTGATVSYTAQTASLTTTDGKAALTGTMDGLVTGRNLTSVLNNLSWTAQSSKVGSGQNSGSTSQSIAAGSKVSFIAGDNMILTQDGTNFTYALNSSLTGMNTIAFTGLGNGASNLTIGLQNGGGANSDKGYYITGLSNTKWDQSNYEGTRAATEAQLREAIDKVSAATGTGGFGLTADEGANNGGEKKVSQTLGRTIAIQGDGTYGADGTVVKQGNISTVAYTDNAGPTGAIKVKLNKDIDLSEAGSLTIGASTVSAGSIVLDNTGDAAKKIALNSTAGTASIGGVTVNGAAKTVMGLANTTWDGTAVSSRAATEDQLAKAISDVSEQATNSELHIRKGTYSVGKDKDGQDVADSKGKNSVSIDVVNAKGTVDGQVVINDVAKASELGAVGELAANLKNPAGGPTTVVQAVNNVNQKVDDSLKQVNGDITNAVTEAKKHTEVKSVDSDNNVTIDGTTTNAAGGTVYKLGLNKDHLNLGNVHIYGNEGRVTAKTVEAEMVKIDDQTRLDKTGLTTGNTMVANNRIVVGGDNGIKIEANGGQQTISGLTNTDWTGTAVHGRAATEDQLAKAISSATTTAAQNEQHVQAGTYDIQTTTDDKGNKQNKVTMKIVDGNGNDKGTVTINDVAKASNVGDTDKLAADIKNQNGGQPQTTSVVEAVNNLNEKVNNRVGDNKYSAITSTDPVQDGDSSTMAIGKLNNRMNDIYDKATQHASVSVDENLTMDDTKQNASGGTDYKIGLNKEQINLGNVTIKGNAGSIEAKSMKADSFTAGDTVVNKDGVKVGDKSALTGDSLKVGGKTYVDDKGINANGKAIGNVGDGKKDTDAVNVKQLNDVKSDYKAADTKLAEAIQQTDAGLNEVGRAVNKLGNRLNRVGAGAAALAALHPGTYDPNDKWDFSAGIGHYHDANAVAIGAYYHPNDTTILSIGGSMGGGENMVNAGVTWKMGRSSHEPAPVVVRKAATAPVVQPSAPVRLAPVVAPTPVTAPVPAKTVVPSTPASTAPAVTTTAMTAAPSGDTAALTQILARQTAILEKLAQNQSQAARPTAVAHGDDIFPDVPENHWAYAYVAKLEKAGALKGFKRPAVLKSPMMTRDDFASVLYTAMANGATTNSALNGDDSLNRLAQEFKAELKDVKP